MSIYGSVQRAVEHMTPKLWGDPNLGIEVTWRRFAGSTFDAVRGVNVESYDNFTLTALGTEKAVGFKHTSAFPPGPGAMAIGDVVYVFLADGMPTGISVRDLLIDGDFTYGVEKIFPVIGLIVKVEVKGYA